MRKLFFILLVLLLSSCHERIVKVEEYNLHFDDFTIELGNKKASVMIEDGFYLGDYEEETIEYEKIFYDVYYNNQNIGDLGFTGFGKEVNFDDAILSYANIYIYAIPSDIYLDDYLLSEDIEIDCKELSGKLVEKNGKGCIINKRLDDKDVSVILQGDISDINQNKLDRIEIFIEKH